MNYRDLPGCTSEREISLDTPQGFAAWGIENFEFIVSERVQVNTGNSRAMSVLTFFIIQIEYTAGRNTALKPRKNTSTSLNEKFKIHNLPFQSSYSPSSCFLGVLRNCIIIRESISSSDKSSNFESTEAMVLWQWCVEFTPQLFHHYNDVREIVSSQPSIPWYKSANQKVGIYTVYESWIINTFISCRVYCLK